MIDFTLRNEYDVAELIELLYARLGKKVRVELESGYDGFEYCTIKEEGVSVNKTVSDLMGV